MSSVLDDAQGPRAKRRNVVLTVVFLAAVVAVVWWVFSTLKDKGQLEWVSGRCSSPAPRRGRRTSGRVWRTPSRPRRWRWSSRCRSARYWASPASPTHASVRVPVSVVVEFFRAIPVLVLMIFGLALFAES
ncbi:amino acid ABC transporter permease [Streptomyces violaceorubidus]